jgi:chromosome segregation ATPase
MLQKSLEKLTNDFEICAKDLSTTQAHIKESEFELETLVRQFNVLGDEKTGLDERFEHTSSVLSVTQNDLNVLRNDYDQVLLAKAKFEADSRLQVIEFEGIIYNNYRQGKGSGGEDLGINDK